MPVPVVVFVAAETPTAPDPPTPVPFVEVPLTPKLKRPSPLVVCRSSPSSPLRPLVMLEPSAFVVAINPLPVLEVLFIPEPLPELLSTRHGDDELQAASAPESPNARAACVLP
jgi:hypothetical protein